MTLDVYKNEELRDITAEFARRCGLLFEERLYDVRLFGSFARGDFDEESDVDIITIVDMEESELRKYLDEICKIAVDLDFAYNIFLSPLLQSKQDYENRINLPGFYENIAKESIGVL
jgi:predicted nucleotidyltransferase